MAIFNLKFPESQIQNWAGQYAYPMGDPLSTAAAGKSQGYLTKAQLLKFVHWKAARSKPLVTDNDPILIQDATAIALSTPHEQLRIGVLLAIKGVAFPVASVVLHFCHSDPYPIVDRRALWSLGYDQPPTYNYAFWKEYVDYCRTLANASGVDMRTLDKAFWQFSKDSQ